MCYVRGDPRTADYTVRFVLNLPPAPPGNDNSARLEGSLPVGTYPTSKPPPGANGSDALRAFVSTASAATRLAMAVVACLGVWLAFSLVPLVIGVFG
jgi:hypothetical protein